MPDFQWCKLVLRLDDTVPAAPRKSYGCTAPRQGLPDCLVLKRAVWRDIGSMVDYPTRELSSSPSA